MGYAEVSLVLDNAQHCFPLEEQEIMVTRRFYRSGDSEYYINRRSCRLRDIHELFMDTGLGQGGLLHQSARAKLMKFCPPRAPSAGASLRKRRASPATVTGRRRRSGN